MSFGQGHQPASSRAGVPNLVFRLDIPDFSPANLCDKTVWQDESYAAVGKMKKYGGDRSWHQMGPPVSLSRTAAWNLGQAEGAEALHCSNVAAEMMAAAAAVI